MEAELTALREELSSRSKNNNGTAGSSNGTKQELTNHSNISNGNESENSPPESVIKKSEMSNDPIAQEEANWLGKNQDDKI